MAYLPSFGQLDPVTGLPKKRGGTVTSSYGDVGSLPGFGLPSPGPVTGFTPAMSTNITDYPNAGRGAPAAGGGFDVKGLLDSLLNPIKSDLLAQGQVDLAGRNAGINRALVQYGQLPDFGAAQKALGLNLGEVVSPDTAQLATSNPYSATKQLATQHTDAVRQIRRALAARGMLSSGDLGFQLNKENQAYGQAGYDATQKLLDFLGALQQGYLSGQQQRSATLANSANGAIGQLLQMFPSGFPTAGGGGGEQQQAPPPPTGGGTPPPAGGTTIGGGPTAPGDWRLVAQQNPITQAARLRNADYGQLP